MCKALAGKLPLALWTLSILAIAPAAQAQVSDLKWTGYYKNLLTDSSTWSGEPYTLDLNRLRLELKGALAPSTDFNIQYDNDVLLGNYLGTTQFQQQKHLPPPQYWRADASYVDNAHLYGVHRLYRATLDMAMGDTDLHLGRQRIAWGTGRFWSPLDVLNPVNPIALERGERPGVDAILIERKLGPLSRVSAVAAPSRNDQSSAAAQWHDHVGTVDYSVIAGQMLGRQIWGGDLAGQIGSAGIRGEFTHEQVGGMTPYNRALVGLDYTFSNTLTITAELYFNGAGARDPSGYDWTAQMTGTTQALGRRYLGTHAGFEITPLLTWDTELVINLGDRSLYLSTGMVYSWRANVDMRLGTQRFSGADKTEYSRPPDSVYVQLQRFF